MSEVSQALSLVQKDFKLDGSSINELPSPSFEEVLVYLEGAISHLLDHDFERLLQIMYRIDIDENRFKEVLQSEESKEIAAKLARMVLDRELEKVRTRAEYKVPDAGQRR